MAIDEPYLLDPFRQIVNCHWTTQFELACQLHSGATYSEYNVPGIATAKTSANNLMAKDGLQGFTNVSAVWNDGTRYLVTNFAGTKKWPAPPTPTATTTYSIKGYTQSIWDKKYIGKQRQCFEGELVSPAIIQTIVEVEEIDSVDTEVEYDYIVYYTLKSSATNEVTVRKYKTAYDEAISQASVALSNTVDKSLTYSDSTDIRFCTNVDVLDVNEKTYLLPQQARSMTVNKAGTKLLFFVDLKNDSSAWGTDYRILELTDITDPNPLADTPVGDTFSIAVSSNYVADDVYTSTGATLTESGDYEEVSTVTVACSPGVVTRDSDGEGDHTASWTAGYFDTEKSVFLGVAYSKYDDSILILDRYEEVKDDWPRTQTYYETKDMTVEGYGSDYTGTETSGGTQTRTRKDDKQSLRINGTDIATAVTAEFYTSTIEETTTTTAGTPLVVVETCTNSGTTNKIEEEISSYFVVDLSSKILGYRKLEWSMTKTYSRNCDDTPTNPTEAITTYDRIYVYANGVTTKIWEDSAADTSYYVKGINYVDKGLPSLCVGDTIPDFPVDCPSDAGTYSCTTTWAYEIVI